MRVIVLPGWYPGKYTPANGNFFREQVRLLRQSGVEASVLFADLDFRYYLNGRFSRPQASFVVEEGVPVYRLSGGGLPKRHPLLLNRWARHYFRLFDAYVARRGRPDLFHGHTFWGGYIARQLSRRYGIPYVVTEHATKVLDGRYAPWQGQFYRDIYADATHVVAVSRPLAAAMETQFGVREVEVIPNYIDPDLFFPRERRPGGRARFVAVGDLIPRKRFDLLLEALHLFGPAVRPELVIVGDGPLRGRLVRQVQARGLGDDVTFTGYLEPAAVAKQMQQADFLVSASDVETFGIVLAEAMACGLPVVATGSGGPSDVITPGTGLLVRPGDAGALSAGMKQLIEEDASYDRIQIREYAVSRFGKEAVLRRIIEVYEAVRRQAMS